MLGYMISLFKHFSLQWHEKAAVTRMVVNGALTLGRPSQYKKCVEIRNILHANAGVATNTKTLLGRAGLIENPITAIIAF